MYVHKTAYLLAWLWEEDEKKIYDCLNGFFFFFCLNYKCKIIIRRVALKKKKNDIIIEYV